MSIKGSFSAWALAIYYYIQKLAKNNTVEQYISAEIVIDMNDIKIIKGVKSWCMNLATKLLLGIDTRIIESCGSRAYEINDSYYKRNNVTTMKKKWDKISFDKYAKNLHLGSKDILILTEDAIAYNRVDEEKYIESMNELYSLLHWHFPLSYIVKTHPNTTKVYGKINGAPKIPSYIPAEFLLFHKWKYIIGAESSILFKGANETKAKVISLIYVLPFLSRSVQDDFKKFFDGMTDKILYPENMKELGEMMND